MSGDVQPRKRKDKRRKKADGDYHIQRIRGASFDEDDAGTPPPTLVNPSSENSTDNVTIHVHKESGTGGHWCARIVFFALLSVLVGLVGIIIFEHRGSTDVDTPIADSRWAMVFDGWVDDVVPQHDEEPHEEASEENDEHDKEEETEEDEKGDHEEEEEAEDEEEEEEEDTADTASPEVDKEEDEGIGSDEDTENEEEEEEEEEEEKHRRVDEGDEEDEDQQSIEEKIYQKNTYGARREVTRDEKPDENDEGFDGDNSAENGDDFGTLEELENVSDEDADGDDNENEGDGEDDDAEREQDEEDEEERERAEAHNTVDSELDVSIEGVRASTENDDGDLSQEYFSIPGVLEIDENSAEPLEEIEDGELEDLVNELEIEPDEDQEVEEESSSVAVKFGVGVALIVAAHFVLVRRWNNVEADATIGPYANEAVDLSRRNTLVPPLNPKDLITANETEDKSAIRDDKIVETYEQLRDKYKNLEAEKLALRNVSKQEKNANQAKTGKRADEFEETMTSESERLSATEAEEEEEEDDDDEEISDEEEEEEEEDEDEEEDEQIEEPDDSELVAKLEAKYGKLPTPTESEDEEEEDYEDEDEEEEEEEEEEPDEEDAVIQGWKRIKTPTKGAGAGAPAVQQSREPRRKDQPKRSGAGGGQSAEANVHGPVNESSPDETSIKEETNDWLSKEFDN